LLLDFFERNTGMQSRNGNGVKLPRRNVLAYLTSGAAMLGGASLLRGEESARDGARPAGGQAASVAELARIRDVRTRKASSYDRTGGNGDAIAIEPAQTAVLLQENGPGVITHLWFTINSSDPYHLKNLVLRMYWDGEKEPSVEVPIGDFFGLGLGDYFLYQSALTTVAPMKALNAYFPMPFGKSALISVTNEGMVRTDNFYYNLDYELLPALPEDLGYFHAQYRQATPSRGWIDPWQSDYMAPAQETKNLSGAHNYVFMEARGRGHLIGVTQAVLQNEGRWMGEGDEMIFIDEDTTPTINGTGTEDYYNGAWDFGGPEEARPFAYLHNGAPYIVDAERAGGRYCLYRWHTDNPVRFETSLKFTIEHGDNNHRFDNFFSVAYWYQTEPHMKFPELPPVAERVPRIYQVEEVAPPGE
jgi:D-arabinan exo alpha-(1,3)/(1,5)-arabinofuranosidase (non-reducing end)